MVWQDFHQRACRQLVPDIPPGLQRNACPVDSRFGYGLAVTGGEISLHTDRALFAVGVSQVPRSRFAEQKTIVICQLFCGSRDTMGFHIV